MIPTSKPTRGRKPIDPDGSTQALTIRVSTALKAVLVASASGNGRSLSQEIAARLAAPPPPEASLSPLAELVAAFEERLVLFCHPDWREAEAAAALNAGLRSLLERVVARSSDGKDAASAKIGEMVAELTHTWLEGRNDGPGLALRNAFRGTSS